MITFNLNYIHFSFFESRSTLTDWLNNISGFTSSETQNQSTSSPPPLAFSFIFYCFIPWKNPAHCFPFAKKIKKNRELDGQTVQLSFKPCNFLQWCWPFLYYRSVSINNHTDRLVWSFSIVWEQKNWIISDFNGASWRAFVTFNSRLSASTTTFRYGMG